MPGMKGTPYDDNYISPPAVVRSSETPDVDFDSIQESFYVPREGTYTRCGLNDVFVLVSGCNVASGECDLGILCDAEGLGWTLTDPDAAWCSAAMVSTRTPGSFLLSPAPPGEYKVRLIPI